jgi:hypothetical protein
MKITKEMKNFHKKSIQLSPSLPSECVELLRTRKITLEMTNFYDNKYVELLGSLEEYAYILELH